MYYFDFKTKYLSFAFRSKNYFEKELSFYYFRLLQIKENDPLIIPLDSNIANPFDPIFYNAYFLLKNEYNEFSLNYSVFSAFRNEEYDINYFEYPIQNEVDISQDNLLDISQDNLNNIIIFESFTELERPIKFLSQNNSNHLYFILFYFVIVSDLNTYILSTFYNKENNIYPQIYSSEIYLLDYMANFNFFMQSYFSLTLRWINGEGHINNLNNENFELNKNFIGKPYSYSIENIANITCINKNNFSLYLDLNYISGNNIREMQVKQTSSEIIRSKYFPIYYFIKVEFSYADINLKLIDLENDLTNFAIEGMQFKEHLKNFYTESKYIDPKDFKSDYKGQYDLCSKIGFLKMYLNNDNVPGKFEQNYFLIKIDIEKKEKYKQNSNILIEMLSTGDNYYYEYELPNYMPINQFIYG